jgi:transcriptional regulator GlxA family with amidase domain
MDAASHEWPVERLAKVSGISQAHFARSFKDAFGVPPHRYLLTRRIERATRARQKAAGHQPEQVPACHLAAAFRPDLTIAVSEKRRLEADDKLPPD